MVCRTSQVLWARAKFADTGGSGRVSSNWFQRLLPPMKGCRIPSGLDDACAMCASRTTSDLPPNIDLTLS